MWPDQKLNELLFNQKQENSISIWLFPKWSRRNKNLTETIAILDAHHVCKLKTEGERYRSGGEVEHKVHVQAGSADAHGSIDVDVTSRKDEMTMGT